jgi:putative transposon-encoded protein
MGKKGPTLWAVDEPGIKAVGKQGKDPKKETSIPPGAGQWLSSNRDTETRGEGEQGGRSWPEDRRHERPKVKFEVYGEEMIEKEVKYSGNSGRVYLPPEWVGKHIKVIRTD